jgi:ankyrin repeat protein
MNKNQNWVSILFVCCLSAAMGFPSWAGTDKRANVQANELMIKLISDSTTPSEFKLFGVTRAKSVSVQSLSAVVDQGADVNLVDPQGDTPLSQFALCGNYPCVRYLILHGAQVNKREHSATPLIAAAVGGNVDCVKLLLANGAKISDVDATGANAFSAALRYANIQCIKYFISKGFSVSKPCPNGFMPLVYATASENLQCIRYVLSFGADVNAKGTGPSALGAAVLSGDNPSIVKFLIDNGADVHGPAWPGAEGYPPISMLEAARQSGNSKIISLLKKHGAK